MGGADARGRILRGLRVLRAVRGGGAEPDAIQARDPNAPGARCRGDPVCVARRRGPDDPLQHTLRHHPRQHRSHRRKRPGHAMPRGGRCDIGGAFQRQHGSGPPAGPIGARRRTHPLRDDDHHQQCRRRTTGESGQHQAECGVGARVRQALHHRRLPLRRECLVHQATRIGSTNSRHPGHRPRHVRVRRRHDDVGKEGRVREYRRLAGAER